MHWSALNFLQRIKNRYLSEHIQHDAGFSMVEVVAVTLMIGILAMIAIPSWFSFINQQRVNKANDVVFSAVQEAQREAKQKKLSYSVSFKIENQVSKLAIHPDSTAASSLPSNQWQSIDESLGIKSGQITLFTNLTGKNTVNSSNPAVNTSTTYLNNPQTITFDYMGTLPNFITPTTGEAPGLKIIVAASNNSTKRCVIVKTILGSTLRGKNNECN
ncbi:MAG: prepilin-type N-terminal cleavage/methylation domain-containing protein [Nostoc sp. TH1S01]|nr:prepilin-type N-terminal cleavage/methylation domain-containing protein [Nostoc sp. TH1S01]